MEYFWGTNSRRQNLGKPKWKVNIFIEIKNIFDHPSDLIISIINIYLPIITNFILAILTIN